MLQLDWATLLIQIVNFVVLVALLGFFLFRPLRRKLSERGQIIAETLQQARDQEAQAQQLREEWEGRMRTVQQESEEILRRAQRLAEERTSAMYESARQRIDRLTDEMRADLLRHRDEVVAEHYDEILDAIDGVAEAGTGFRVAVYESPQLGYSLSWDGRWMPNETMAPASGGSAPGLCGPLAKV